MQIYVLDQSSDQKTINLIFHFTIPATNNDAGVCYQAALVGYLGGSSAITSKVPGSPDLAALQAGSIYEYPFTLRWSQLGLNQAQMLAQIQAAYTAEQTTVLADLQNRLLYYGYSQ